MAFTHLFVIGDSLVDAGNALGLAEWYDGLPFQDLPEGAPTPGLGYFNGRFSNGYTFADLVANKAIGVVTDPIFPYHFEDPWLGVPIAPFAGDPSGNNLNFAYGGSHIRNGQEVVPDLDGQTDALRDALDNKIPSTALILVTTGGNDVRDLAPTGADPVPQAAAYAELWECATQLRDELKQLINDGARNICITGIADVGLIPRYDRDGDGVLNATEQMRSDAATDYSIHLDMLIRTLVVPALQATGANITYVPLIDYVDASGNLVVGALSANLPMIAALHGLTTQELTDNLRQYNDLIFFDHVHPNAQAHALLGAYMQSIVAGTPWVETPPLMGANVDYSVTAAIGAPREVDRVTASLVAGTTYTIEMLGISSLGTAGSLGDPTLRLLGPDGSLVRTDDDSGAGFDATMTFTAATSGNYTLEFSAVGSVTGAYSLQAAVIAGSAMATSNTYAVSSASTVVIEGAGGLGQDVISTSVSYALSAGSEIETLQTNRASAKTPINLTGNEFAQTLIGNTGANVLEGKGGADILYGNKGNDRFVLSNDAVTSPGAANIDAIMDYAAGDLVDVTRILAVAPGTDVSGGGYLRVTKSGLIQVDLDGGGNDWITLSTINGAGAVAMRYLSGETATELSLSRVSESAPAAAAFADPVDRMGFELWHYAPGDLWL
jgi:phospholipase/lecithinase/hemolysin